MTSRVLRPVAPNPAGVARRTRLIAAGVAVLVVILSTLVVGAGAQAVGMPRARLSIAVGSAGSSAKSITGQAAPASSKSGALAWSGAVIDHQRGELEAISCPTASSCVAVDNFGNAVVERAGVWGPATPVAPTSMWGISCASTTFCVAIGLNFVVTYNGTSWSAPKVIDTTPVPHLWQISCPTTTFCGIVNALGYFFTYTAGTWAGHGRVDVNDLDSISCPSPTMCMTIDPLGVVSRWNGTTWTSSQVLDAELAGLEVEQVSCPSTTFCAATSDDRVADWHGTSWSTSTQLVSYPNDLLNGLACGTAGSCVVLDVLNNIWTTSTGAAWTEGPNDGYVPSEPGTTPLRALTCTGGSISCQAIGTLYEAFPGQDTRSFSTNAWSGNVVADPYDFGTIDQVSCATPTFCAAIDQQGFVIMKNGATWGAPTQLLNPKYHQALPEPDDLICPSAGRCILSDTTGAYFLYNGTSWSHPMQIGIHGGYDITCPTMTFCMAKDKLGDMYTYNGTTWTAMPAPPLELWLLQCTSSTFCTAVDENGDIRTWRGTGWSGPVMIGTGDYQIQELACSSPTQCMTLGSLPKSLSTYEAVWNGQAWTTPTPGPTSPSGLDLHCLNPNLTCHYSGYGTVATVTNGKPGPTVKLSPNPGTGQVSCPTATYCVFVGNEGLAFTGQ